MKFRRKGDSNGSTPCRLLGWTKNFLKPGDQVTIVGSPTKNGSLIGMIQKVMLSGGQELRS
jgi:hypothetical protein